VFKDQCSKGAALPLKLFCVQLSTAKLLIQPPASTGTIDLNPLACIGDPASNGDPDCIPKHCKLAILNFLCVYGILDFSTNTNKHVYISFWRSSTAIGPTCATTGTSGTPSLYWRPGL